MGNIFDERRDSELVQARDKMSLKSAPPPAPPAPKKSEQPAPPEASAPAGQPREGTQQAPSPISTSIPFVPPVGYGVVPSSALSFDKQRDWFQSQEQAVMDGNVQAILPLVQQQTFTNPYTDQTMNSGEAAIRARQWNDQFNGNLQREWDSYVTYSNHGVNPATQFDESGNAVHRATESEIRQGLNGLTSRLGQSLKAATDNENWFGRVVNGAMNTVMFGTRAVQDLTGIGVATILDAPGVNQLGDKVAEYLFQGDPAAVKQHERWIRQQKMIWDKGDVGQRGERRQQILQQAPVRNSVSDFDDNLLGKVFYTLSLPENLVMGAVYEFADGFLRLRGQDPGVNPGGRIARALYGQDLSILNRASSEKYLGWMEPEGTQIGEKTGNIFWDAPENLQQTLGMIGLVPDDPRQKQNQLRWLHWSMQAAPTVAVSMFIDPPIDFAIGKLRTWNKGAEVAQETLETAATVPGKLPGDMPTRPNVMQPTATAAPGITSGTTIPVPGTTEPGATLFPTVTDPWTEIPTAAGTTLPLPTPEFPYTTVKGKPSVVTPNQDTAEIIASTLTPGVPARPIDPVDITLVRRSEEDLARMGNRFGVKPETVVLTPAELRMLQRGDADAWARWGKPVSDYVETVDSINLPGGQTVAIGDVYPRALGLPELPQAEELVQRLEGAVSEGLDIDQALTAARTPEDLGALLAKKEVNNRMQAMLRDSIPPETAWTENVHLLPPALNPPGVQAPEVIDAGTQYIETVLKLEDTAANMKALDIQFDSLRTVDEYIESRLASLPNAGRQDFQDIQATRGMYGLDDMSDRPLTQEVPSTFDDVALEQRLGELEMQKADLEVQQAELDNPLLAKSKELLDSQRAKRGVGEWNPEAIEQQQAKIESLYEKGAPDRVIEREEAKLMKMQGQDPYLLDTLEEQLELLNQADIDTDTLSKVYTDVNRMLVKEFNQLEYEKMINDIREMVDKSGKRPSANLKPVLEEVVQEMENIQEMRPMPPREVQPEEVPSNKMNDDYFAQLEARQQKEREARLTNKTITDPAELDLISRIKAAFPDRSARVYLADVREQFPEITDDLLTRMEKDGHASLQTFNDPQAVTPRHTAAAVQWGGEPRYFMYLKEVDEVPPVTKADPVDLISNDPELRKLEAELTTHIDNWQVEQQNRLAKSGSGDLDSPEFRKADANELYDRLVILDKQATREGELLGGLTKLNASHIVEFKSMTDEYDKFYTPAQRKFLAEMYAKYDAVLPAKAKAAKKTTSKYPTMPSNAELPVAQIGDDYWQHGTRSQGDVRTWVARNGSGAHELGLGVYFTQNRLVAEAAATKFNLRNVPMNVNADFSAPPHIKTVSTVNIQTVLDMNHLLSKSEFDNVFGGAFLHVMDNDPAQVNAFWQKFKTKYNGELGYLYDAYAEHLAETLGHADGLLIRTFQEQMFDVLQKYDAGVFTGKNGESMLVVYNPARLVNVNVEDLRRGVNTDVTPPTPKTPEPVTAQPTPATVDVTAQTVDPTVTPAESPGFKFNKKPEMYNAMDDLSTGGDDVPTMGTRPGDDMPNVDPYSVMDIDTGLDEVDEMVEALEAQRYLDHYTAQVVTSDAQQVRHLESTQELVQYEQQRVAEAMGEEFTRHSEDLETLLETQSSLHEFSRAKTEKLITEYDTATEASSAFTRATTQVSETDLVAEAMRKNKQFRKFRNKLEKKLDRLHKKLGEVGINSKAHEKLLAEIDDLTRKVADIDNGFSHQIRVMKALAGRNPATGMDWQKMTEFQRLADLQNLNPNWWGAKGEWLTRSAFEKARNRVQQFAARYIDSALGGDVGKVRDQLFNLKRVGQGQFAAMLADIEASSRIKGTWKNAQEYLKGTGIKLPQRQVHELLSELMELQASPYLMDEAFANTQVAKFLQAKLAETYKLGMSFGLSQVQLDDLSNIVREIPQVYHEVRDLAQKMGINFGDEITLGYLPRELKETVMFMIGEHGVKHTSDAADNFRKSRTLFHYVPEDSMLMEQVLDTVNSKWRETLNVKSFDELIGREGDSKLLAALNGILTEDDLDMLNEMGVLRKIPFTQVESAKFIAQKYDLPFNNLTRIYMSDPAEAFQLYKKGLQDKAAKSGIANGLIGAIGEMSWHSTTNSPAPKGWVKLTDLGLQGYIPSDFAEYAQDLFVHPFVADELHAMYHIQTSPGILSMVGDIANLVYKYTAGSMLATPRWLTMQVLGNLSNVVKRGINPQLFTDSVYKNFKFFNNPEELIKSLRTSKEFMGGKYSQQEMWNLGIKLGILDVDMQVYGTAAAGGRFHPKESIDEFFHYLQKGGYHREYAEGFKVSHDPILHGVISRLIAGGNEVLDQSIYRLLDMGNKVTDNALKFALFQAVTKDDPGWVRHIPGFNPRVFNNLPHFTDPVKAAEWVRNASYTFDQVGTNENLMRYIMPFWTFQRLSFMETARWVAANPAKFAGYVHIVSATQNNFEEEDSAAWEALMGSGWMAESMPIPVKIPADQSASGEDEYYVYPLATLSPSAGALGLPGKIASMFGFDFRGQEASPKDSRANKYAGKPQNFAEWMRQEGSPFARTILSVFDPTFLDPFSTKADGTVEERTNYPLGLSRTGWAYTKLWAPWVSTLVKLSPESVKGRPARVNPRTGAFEEGTPDFLGNVPTSLTGGNIYGNSGFFDGFMQNVGLAPVSFDMLLQQGFSMTEIKSQLYTLEKDAKRIHSLLRNPTPGYKKEDLERQLSELQVISLHLRAQYDIYREWRRLNDLPHPRALKQIEQANLKVDKLLPESERQRIYRENWERYRRQFQ